MRCNGAAGGGSSKEDAMALQVVATAKKSYSGAAAGEQRQRYRYSGVAAWEQQQKKDCSVRSSVHEAAVVGWAAVCRRHLDLQVWRQRAGGSCR